MIPSKTFTIATVFFICSKNHIIKLQTLRANSKKKNCIFNKYANWSRFYINNVYPNIEKGLYLDLDILFRGNIDKIFTINFEDKAIGVVSYCGKKSKRINYSKGKKDFEKEFNINYDKINNNYNCGVIYYNFSKLKNLSTLIENILEYQVNNGRICKQGTEPIHNILFNEYVELDKKYNCIPTKKKINGIIIHFKGQNSYDKMSLLVDKI